MQQINANRRNTIGLQWVGALISTGITASAWSGQLLMAVAALVRSLGGDSWIKPITVQGIENWASHKSFVQMAQQLRESFAEPEQIFGKWLRKQRVASGQQTNNDESLACGRSCIYLRWFRCWVETLTITLR
jgi:hypothetical protein